MKNKLVATSILVILTISLLGVSLNTPNLAQGQVPLPELRVEPSTYEATHLNETFDINITINDLNASLKAVSVQFRLCYNDTLLEFVDVAEGPFMKQFNNTATPPFTYFMSFNESDGIYGPHVLVGIQLIPNATGEWTNFPYGSGTLATITFKAIYRTIEPEPPATCPLTLIDTMILDEDLTEIDHSTVDATYQAPHHPLTILRVEPSEYHPTELNENFNVDVTISNLDADLRAVSVEFRLCYDDALLEVVDVAEGSFLKDPRWNLYGTYFINYIEPDGVYGPHVLVGILLLPNDATGEYDQTQFPEGSGTLATMTFKALSPCSPCLFSLKDTMILDKDIKEIEHAPHYPLTTLKVEPSTYSATHLDETFDINVTISNLDALWKAVSVQFRLCYNDTLLEFVDVAEGPFMKQFNNTATPPFTYFMSFNESDGIYGPHVLVGIQLIPNATGEWTNFPYGSGTLATITFKAIYRTISPTPPAKSLLSLKDTMILNEDLSEIEHYAEAAIYHAPHFPIIILGVEPSTYSATELYETFSVNVTINNLDSDLKAVAVQFRLCYDDTLLEVVDVTEGPFMQQFPNAEAPPFTYFTYFIESDAIYGSNVLVGILLVPNATGEWTNFPEGDGTLATITFKAIYQHRGLEKPPLCCNLTLVDTMIIDEDLEELPLKTEPGQYCIYPRHIADLNEDGKVDMQDIAMVARAFGSYPGHERWDPICDINGDGKVDMRDVAGVARLFGWTA